MSRIKNQKWRSILFGSLVVKTNCENLLISTTILPFLSWSFLTQTCSASQDQQNRLTSRPYHTLQSTSIKVRGIVSSKKARILGTFMTCGQIFRHVFYVQLNQTIQFSHHLRVGQNVKINQEATTNSRYDCIRLYKLLIIIYWRRYTREYIFGHQHPIRILDPETPIIKAI